MIDGPRASAIGHGEMPFHNPISESAVDTLIGLLPLGAGDRALDVGCGRGELLIRLAERLGGGPKAARALAAKGFSADSIEAAVALE